jgi:homoserine kinase
LRSRVDVQSVSAFAPATVSNVACGFDVLGFALERPGDVVTAIPDDAPGARIVEITGDAGRLPREAARNTATRAADALLRALNRSDGIGLMLRKELPLASGIGSSAASAVAAVLAVNELLSLGASESVLLESAMEGERASAGAVHADNVAPALLGGFVLVRSIDPPDIIRLPVPDGLSCAVLHPSIEVETRAARALLPPDVPLAEAVRHWANVGALVAALYTRDFDLLRRSLVDTIIEPRRAHLVPGFAEVKRAAMDAGALGCSFSGAGPSVFALSRSLAEATDVGNAMRVALLKSSGVAGTVLTSPVSSHGARIV